MPENEMLREITGVQDQKRQRGPWTDDEDKKFTARLEERKRSGEPVTLFAPPKLTDIKLGWLLTKIESHQPIKPQP